MRIAIGVEYNGAEFSGWQHQPALRTVQHVLESALSRVADGPVTLVAAGRTDAGVHATGQVAHFDTDATRSDYSWWRGTNSYLPDDVSVLWAREVDADFHARFGATARSYRYILTSRSTRPAALHGLVGWDHRPLDAERMQAAVHSLVGEHDFSAFRAAGCQARSPVRCISRASVARHGDWLCVDVTADAFLQHMVRNIVGVLTAIGCGERPVEWAREVLASRDRKTGAAAVAPDGLYLTSIRYPERYDLPPPQPAARFW
jgi:tRNA pseudouridine38-40 synthase